MSIFFVCVYAEYVEYTDGTITPTSNVNANSNPNPNPPPPPSMVRTPANVVTTKEPVQRTPGRIADYDPLSEARPSPYSTRQAATTVIYTSDKGAGICHFHITVFSLKNIYIYTYVYIFFKCAYYTFFML